MEIEILLINNVICDIFSFWSVKMKKFETHSWATCLRVCVRVCVCVSVYGVRFDCVFYCEFA